MSGLPPTSLATRFLYWLTGREGIPFLARQTFRIEFFSIFTFAVATAAMEGNFIPLFAKKTLLAPDWVVAAISAGGALGNLAAAITAPMLARRRQVPFLVARLIACAGILAVVACLPPVVASSYLFAGIMLVMAMLNSTAVNARTSLWQCNYPDHLRGQIVSRFILLNMALVAGLSAAQSYLLDRFGWFHHMLFGLAAASAIATAMLYSRLRLRGEKARLRRVPAGPALNPMEVVGVLWKDRLYARYMFWQMVMGSATLAVEPVLVLILADHFNASYWVANIPLVIVPTVVRLLSTPHLGRLYDTMNIFVFRSLGAGFWGLGRMVIFLGTAFSALSLVGLGRAFTGMGSGFGDMAWSMGHMNFAPPDKGPLYLGTHMLLTGVRGAVMPFLGMLLYTRTPVGIHLLWITGLCHFIAAAGLWSMRKEVPPIGSVRG